MSNVLGLDIGTNSVGWAIVDTERRKIVDLGCRTFQFPIEEINVNGKILLKKSTKKREFILGHLHKGYRFINRHIIISIFFLLQIATLFLLLINLHDWRFWFGLSFSVLIALLSIFNGNRK
jgi:Uncharacterized protein conserved in bacteria